VQALPVYLPDILKLHPYRAAGEKPADLYPCGCPFVDVLLVESELGDPEG
jgi:hypothetical protein